MTVFLIAAPLTLLALQTLYSFFFKGLFLTTEEDRRPKYYNSHRQYMLVLMKAPERNTTVMSAHHMEKEAKRTDSSA